MGRVASMKMDAILFPTSGDRECVTPDMYIEVASARSPLDLAPVLLVLRDCLVSYFPSRAAAHRALPAGERFFMLDCLLIYILLRFRRYHSLQDELGERDGVLRWASPDALSHLMDRKDGEGNGVLRCLQLTSACLQLTSACLHHRSLSWGLVPPDLCLPAADLCLPCS